MNHMSEAPPPTPNPLTSSTRTCQIKKANVGKSDEYEIAARAIVNSDFGLRFR